MDYSSSLIYLREDKKDEMYWRTARLAFFWTDWCIKLNDQIKIIKNDPTSLVIGKIQVTHSHLPSRFTECQINWICTHSRHKEWVLQSRKQLIWCHVTIVRVTNVIIFCFIHCFVPYYSYHLNVFYYLVLLTFPDMIVNRIRHMKM